VKEKIKPYWKVIADTQLGAVHWQNPQREEDYYLAFQKQCYEAAHDPHCLGILGLGDLRERASLQAKNLGGLNRGLKILADHNKPLLGLMGNHDFTIPNWIQEMCYPSLKDLTQEDVQKAHGFNPKTTLALHYTPKSQLLEAISQKNPEELSLIFLHQSLRELTTQLRQSYDLSLEDLEKIGVGSKKACLVLLGDLHNYGDCQLGSITAAYPGSLEMTDINEGSLGLKSQKISSSPHDYRKFIIHLQANTLEWEPQEIHPRPWIRTKAKTDREAQTTLQILKTHLSEWKTPGCVLATCPRSHIASFQKTLSQYPTLECRIEEYEKDCEETPETLHPHSAINWTSNKTALEELGEKELPEDSLLLLQSLLRHDGSTHNPKNDVLAAWTAWESLKTPTTPNELPNELPQPQTPHYDS